MDWIVLEGVKPWDGRYPLDLDQQQLTVREWGWIRDLSGYQPLTIGDGFDGGDPELFTALAVIAVRRAGRIGPDEVADMAERLADAPYPAAIRVESDTPAEELERDPPVSKNGSAAFSGPGSETSSATPDRTPPDSGIPASATSVSAPATSES